MPGLGDVEEEVVVGVVRGTKYSISSSQLFPRALSNPSIISVSLISLTPLRVRDMLRLRTGVSYHGIHVPLHYLVYCHYLL
jgi:hypothetical protein